MKTIKLNIYPFEELSEKAKETALCQFNNIDSSYIYDEAYKTVKKFHEVFGTKEGSRSWLRVQTNFEENVENLKGLRLRTYIINNFWEEICTPKFIGSMDKNVIVGHKRIKSTQHDNGNVSNHYYSGAKKEVSCPLTGVCYDISLLNPIIQFVNNYDAMKDYYSYMDIDTLMNDCFNELEQDIESEVQAMGEDDFKIEHIEANEIEFLENGQEY